METEVSQDAATTSKKRSKPWTESQEISLIQLVLEKEDLLFGDLKGAWGKSIHRKRSDGWNDIASQLNTRFIDNRRESGEVKKKFFNLKQRAKSKIDVIKKSRGKTGGGPAPPQLNSADEALTQSLEGRPGIHGLEHGVDTDDLSTEMSLVNENKVVTPANESLSELCEEVFSSHNESPSLIPVEKNEKVLSCDQGNTCSKPSKQVQPEKKLSDRISTKTFSKKNQPEATYINTLLDTERIRLEKRKLEMEIGLLEKKQIKVESEIQLNNIRSIYYQFKISNEFGVNVEITKNEQ